MTTETTGFRYYLTYQGVFGRNRKAKFASTLIITLENELNAAAAQLLADKAIVDLKLKPGCFWQLKVWPCHFEKQRFEDGTELVTTSYTIAATDNPPLLHGIIPS